MIQNENNASESIPSFLLKTYEILEVTLLLIRMKNTVTLLAGLRLVRALSSKN